MRSTKAWYTQSDVATSPSAELISGFVCGGSAMAGIALGHF